MISLGLDSAVKFYIGDKEVISLYLGEIPIYTLNSENTEDLSQ